MVGVIRRRSGLRPCRSRAVVRLGWARGDAGRSRFSSRRTHEGTARATRDGVVLWTGGSESGVLRAAVKAGAAL
jgi:hypothetical protein